MKRNESKAIRNLSHVSHRRDIHCHCCHAGCITVCSCHAWKVTTKAWTCGRWVCCCHPAVLSARADERQEWRVGCNYTKRHLCPKGMKWWLGDHLSAEPHRMTPARTFCVLASVQITASVCFLQRQIRPLRHYVSASLDWMMSALGSSLLLD